MGIIPPIIWHQGENRISVFEERAGLNYSITNPPVEETGTICLHLYDTPELRQIALQLISIFRRVLIGNRSTEHSFLPIFWTTVKRPNPAHNVLIALFARVNPIGLTGHKEIAEAYWGIYHKIPENRVEWLEVETDDLDTRSFLIDAPFYRNQRDEYCFDFKEKIILGPDGSIRSISLKNRTRSIGNIADWITTDGKKISVFVDDGHFRYSIKNQSNLDALREEGVISFALYNTPELQKIAVFLILIFKRVLLGTNSAEHCFLPVFWTIHENPSSKQDALIALFARIKRTNFESEIVEACWGICEGSKGAFINSFEVNKPGKVHWLNIDIHDGQLHTLATLNFLKNAPFYHKSKKGYVGMDSYSQHFKEVVTLGPDNRIQSLSLKCVSALDDTIPLDEDNWAITLVSFQAGFHRDFGVGHAQIIWEGIEGGSYFLRCAEILNQGYPGSDPQWARIRIVDTFIPNNRWQLGPTWSRTKELTNRMVIELSREPFFNALPGRIGWFRLVPFSLFGNFNSKFLKQQEIDYHRARGTLKETCLSFAVSSLRYAEIFLPQPAIDTVAFSPSDYIEGLWKHYSFYTENTRIMYKEIGFFSWFNIMPLIQQKNRFQIRGPDRFSLNRYAGWVFRSLTSSIPNRERIISTIWN